MDALTPQRPPAEIYEEKFVPALFGPWGPVVAEAAGIRAGSAVLDVACGTGALTTAAAEAAGREGRVIGLDANPEMLAVARRKAVPVEWREGRAEELPFAAASFDAVVSQFGMMFFSDRPKALSEMMRVLKPRGSLAVAVCGALDRSPGYDALARLLDRLFGRAVGNSFRAPFILGDSAEVSRIATAAGIADARIEERQGTVRFRSISDMISTERACVWTLGGILDEHQFDTLLREAEVTLASFAGPDGTVVFDMPALILTASKSV